MGAVGIHGGTAGPEFIIIVKPIEEERLAGSVCQISDILGTTTGKIESSVVCDVVQHFPDGEELHRSADFHIAVTVRLAPLWPPHTLVIYE
jgi:hypothetical protein